MQNWAYERTSAYELCPWQMESVKVTFSDGLNVLQILLLYILRIFHSSSFQVAFHFFSPTRFSVFPWLFKENNWY